VEIGRSGGEGRGIVQCKEIRGERKETGKEKEKRGKKETYYLFLKL
jgi:hypothetical protein